MKLGREVSLAHGATILDPEVGNRLNTESSDAEGQSTDEPSRPKRRIRYAGRNPRRFDDKYKELDSGKYDVDVAKVIARGQTPAGTHRPIMVSEILQTLRPMPGESVIDCTLGFGGHAATLLAAIQPGGRLIGLDNDPIEITKTESRLRSLGHPSESLLIRRINFSGILQIVAAESPEGVDMILADLGISSMQIDNPSRGFTFKADGPLDMRMNPDRGQPASKLLSKLDDQSLAELMVANSDEPDATLLAQAILKSHHQREIQTTFALVAVIRKTIGLKKNAGPDNATNAVRRVFQTLRIAVNDEFGALDMLLKGLPACLKPGGRVAILTFHSGEDRRVKNAFRLGLSNSEYSTISERVTCPSMEEQRSNPRSSSAKLRFATRSCLS